MILIKKIGVLLNLVHCDFKQFISDIFKKESINITPEQFLVMDMLWKGHDISQQALANLIRKDKNSVTKLVDALEKKALVERIPDKNDRRLNLIRLTEEAKLMQDPVKEIATSAVNSIIKGIPNDELEVFIRVLAQMANNMKEYDININEISEDGKTI